MISMDAFHILKFVDYCSLSTTELGQLSYLDDDGHEAIGSTPSIFRWEDTVEFSLSWA